MLKNRSERSAVLLVFAAVACATGGPSAGGPSPTPEHASAQDTAALIPAGYGSLKQDDIAVRITHNGLTVRAIPLDENFIRTLASDSYRAVAALRESRRARLDSLARRAGVPAHDVWYVSFFNVQQGDARFTPGDIVLTNQAREFRALDIIPLSPGFGEHRVRQGDRADALFVFDSTLDPNQNVTITIEGQTGGDWQSVLRRVEQERSLIRSRAGGEAPVTPAAPVR